MKWNTILFALVIILIGVLVFCNCVEKKEGFKNRRNVQSHVHQHQPQIQQYQAQPPIKQVEIQIPEVQNTTSTDSIIEGFRSSGPQVIEDQVSQVIDDSIMPFDLHKDDDNFSDMVAGSVPEVKFRQSMNPEHDTTKYMTPQDLLPTPDMNQPLMRDPNDPNNFMYERNVFAPLKRRNGNASDVLRGDLEINPDDSGWFKVSKSGPTRKGYFDEEFETHSHGAAYDL